MRFSLHVLGATPLQASTTFVETALGLYTAGRHRIRRKQDGRSVEGWADPGTVNLSPRNSYAAWEADGSSQVIVVFVRDELVARVVGALFDANETVRLTPNDANAYNWRGLVHRARGQYDSAIRDYSEALRLSPDFTTAYNNRGIARCNAGQYAADQWRR